MLLRACRRLGPMGYKCAARHNNFHYVPPSPDVKVLFGTDSHTCNAGAFGQFATGIGNTDASFVMGTGKLLIKSPASMQFALEGEVPDHLLAKVITGVLTAYFTLTMYSSKEALDCSPKSEDLAVVSIVALA